MDHLEKILKSRYFLVKIELISRIEIKWASMKIEEKFWENLKTITKLRNKIGERSWKFSGNLNLEKVCRQSVELKNKFWERLKVKFSNNKINIPSRNYRDQYFEKILRKTW